MEKNVLNVAVFTAIIRKLVRNTIVKNGKHAPNAALVVLFILRLVPNISLVIKKCNECGGQNGHKEWCSQYDETKVSICPECGGKRGLHKADCSQGAGRCPICGNGLQSGRHKAWCYHFTGNHILKDTDVLYVCIECKGINGNHKKTCSHYTN